MEAIVLSEIRATIYPCPRDYHGYHGDAEESCLLAHGYLTVPEAVPVRLIWACFIIGSCDRCMID